MPLDRDLPEKVREILSARTPRPAPDQSARSASVLVPLFLHHDAWHLLFTQRTETVASHRGQISFPGGVRDPEDATPLDTALRETEEEIGLRRAEVTVLGQLDEQLTLVTGFRIWPFVGVFSYPSRFVPSPHEIAEILLLPFVEFCDPANLQEQRHTLADGQAISVYFYRVGGHTVWGATARILHDFLELIRPAIAG